MKKVLSKILILFIILTNLFAPISVGLSKDNIEVKRNKVEAAGSDWYFIVSTLSSNKISTPTSLLSENNKDDVATKTACENAKLASARADQTNGTITGKTCLSVPPGSTIVTAGTTLDSNGDAIIPKPEDSNLACTFPIGFKPGACIAQGLYWLFFKTTSALFALAGKIMDYTLKYSLDDTSYRSSFVVEGWGLVRDFCNMFFIFVLLYIAFGTILNLHSVKTKEMIINVVIIGLLINFSLFATQIIIDTSNILARVFYNQNTIVTGTAQKDALGNPLPVKSELGDFNEIKLSEAIVSKIDPQKIVLNSQGIGQIPTKNIEGGDESTTTDKGMSVGTFILIIFITTAVNIVGMLVFLSCAFIFIGRVVMLWLAMILAPLAFFSYTVPALQGIKMIGWKHWWSDLLSMAFLAPVFAFFMYIIVGFMDKGLNIVNVSLKNATVGLSSVVAVIVPFIFIMVLLMQAKKIAVSMSGDVGAALSKAGATVGGLALGVATGGAAMAMRGTIGNLGNKIATSKFASTNGAIGRTFGNVGKWAGGKSFDVRATKLGAAAGKGMGVDMGKAKEGGYAKHLSEKVDRRQKRAKELEVHENEPMKQALNKTENDLQDLLVTNAKEIESVDKLIERKRQEASDAERNLKATAPGSQEQINARATLVLANDEVAEAKKKKKYLREGKDYTEVYGKPEDIGKVRNYSKSALADGKSIDDLEILQKEQAQEIKTENATRKGEFARRKARFGGRANKEAEHKIIMDVKMDSGTKV